MHGFSSTSWSALMLLFMLGTPVSAGNAQSMVIPEVADGQVIYRPECFTGQGEVGIARRSLSGGGNAIRSMKSGSIGSASSQSASGSVSNQRVTVRPAPPSSHSVSQVAAPPPPPSQSIPESVPASPVSSPVLDFEAVASNDQSRIQSPTNRPGGKHADWGGTVYLSNDDSMSLASAQRLLYALEQKVRFTLDQVRPHELLNYFSFDTQAPKGGDVFGMTGSAIRSENDVLSVAFAVKGVTPTRMPLDLTMVIDRSCSMNSDNRMGYTKRGLRLMAEQLEQGDRIDIVAFDHQVCTPLENYVVGRDDPALLQQTINQLRPQGSTDLNLGLQTGYGLARKYKKSSNRNSRVMLITDALLNTGNVDHHTVSEVGKALEKDDIRLTGIGVGRQFNDKILDMLTEKGKGAYVFIGSDAVVNRVFGSGFDSLVQTIAHNVQFSLELPPSLAMERFYGEEASKVASDIQPINYYGGTTQLFLQDLVIRNGHLKYNDVLRFNVRYEDPKTKRTLEQVYQTTVGSLLNGDSHNVRKGLALMSFTDLLMEKAMGGEPCSSALGRYGSRIQDLKGDAEISYINGLVEGLCGVIPKAEEKETVTYKVRVDSDIAIGDVGLTCGGSFQSQAPSGGGNVVLFEAQPGECSLLLVGVVDMRTPVVVPHTGGSVRCVVRGGRMQCI